jgi:hypothetical protein
MPLSNPYLDFFYALPPSFRRDAFTPLSATESFDPGWLSLKSAIAGHFAWAVPTEEAIGVIGRHTSRVVEIGAGSGYWAWLMRQAGIDVAAFDTNLPRHAWSKVERGDERAVSEHATGSLLLCWPPWGSDMAVNALARFRGDIVVYVGEWMGGCADAHFFARLVSDFEGVAAAAIPQWCARTDQLMVFRRRRRS